MDQPHKFQDFILALGLTCIGAALAWFLSGGLPFIGIDDAAITRSYAENVANGAGYVYNVGGEKVEGSTAFLWMSILTVAYSLTPTPEFLIIGLCAMFALGAVYITLRLVRALTDWLDVPVGPALWTMALFLMASPGYFMWSVWTMMELALWSMMVIWLVFLLAKRVEDDFGPGNGLGLVLAAALMPLVRPEGILVAVGLICLSFLLSLRSWRVLGLSVLAAGGSFVAVTFFRLSYFGQPFPNTFYAKVSSDRLQGLADGMKYLFDFLLRSPFTDILVMIWLGLTFWALFEARHSRPGTRALIVAAAAIFGLLMTYAALGGDHFVLWRFYQPVAPLLPVALALLVALGAGMPSTTLGAAKVAGAVAALGIMLIGWGQYYQSRFDIRKEYVLVEQGLDFGAFLNEVEPRPSIGVGPAGGIALAYDGHIYDLLGLNWVEMAHANPVKIGMRNHASFDKPTFWRHQPDVLAAFNRACTKDQGLAFWSHADSAFDGLYSDADFQAAYVPVAFRNTTQCWPSFARHEWLARATPSDAILVYDWADVIKLD
ncbi:hypothetical protein [Shimia sp. R9_3]|uniref:hypothetical protein n=1 Tax=Shimia sp. R9_3 TaxID=2821113 RepID=UPI001AD9CB60|nr:hypothetical protein [Shimia sp. R9_3]MBO9402569.1 hypothetical protein [Shimia sp. R9_3]